MFEFLLPATQSHTLYLVSLRKPWFSKGHKDRWLKVRDSSYMLARTVSPVIENWWSDPEHRTEANTLKSALDALEAEILSLDKEYGVKND